MPKQSTPVDVAALDERLRSVSALLAWHRGGIELVDVSAEGAVQLRFTGMCSGCPLKPFTLATSVRPALLDVPGVSRVEANGARISAEAQRRLV